MELTRLQSSPANHQLTSTSKRLNARGSPGGILFQASSSRLSGDAMGSWTPPTLSAAAAAALPAAAGAGGEPSPPCSARQAQQLRTSGVTLRGRSGLPEAQGQHKR